jgi:hypothetical protein
MTAIIEAFSGFARRYIPQREGIASPILSPVEEITNLALGFKYTTPKFGIGGENPKQKALLLKNSHRALDLTLNNPSLFQPESFGIYDINIPINTMELLGLPLPKRIETPEDPMQSLTPEQQDYFEAYSAWAEQLKATHAQSGLEYGGGLLNLNSFVREQSKLGFIKDYHFPVAPHLPSLASQTKTIQFKDGSTHSYTLYNSRNST